MPQGSWVWLLLLALLLRAESERPTLGGSQHDDATFDAPATQSVHLVGACYENAADPPALEEPHPGLTVTAGDFERANKVIP